MTGVEFSNQFDILFNSIASNQAPGLNEYEKSVFLTKAQDELIKNYFNPKGNKYQEGFDGSPKRQMDFSVLMRTHGADRVNLPTYTSGTADYDPSIVNSACYDPRGRLYTMPDDLFIPVNESLRFVEKTSEAVVVSGETTIYNSYDTVFSRQVIPLTFSEYTTLMSKPYKEPLKNQAWRLLTDDTINSTYRRSGSPVEGKLVEIIAGHNDLKWVDAEVELGAPTRLMQYVIRYIKKPKPVLVAPIDAFGMTIEGHDGHWTSSSDYDTAYEYNSSHTEILNPCELVESLHEEILQRAVELAKTTWTATGQDNIQAVLAAGQRSE